jgi:hypothetical protein
MMDGATKEPPIAFSDALLPMILTGPMRLLAGISVNLIVRCGVQFACTSRLALGLDGRGDEGQDRRPQPLNRFYPA